MTTTIANGTRVQVYWNLHRDCFSIVALEGPSKGRVIAHTDRIGLTDATFVVQPAGREKVRRERRKTVHAFIRGRWANYDDSHLWHHPWCNVTYNPYKHDTFVDADHLNEVTRAAHVVGVALPERGPAIIAA